MDLESLRYALTLADELHFGRSAARSHISEPQFGRRIRQLEAHIGIRIFARTSRRVTITTEGSEVLTRIRQIVDAMEALRR
ncbi:LysR family transcriptional regulator [[Mycobacterium] wendilense]|uniref:LysR family transcriptional regulator n=1 Tax=[Mycobacterium] wendilense TaxID=3064284 RepID=A0ABM9MKJ7_9MYCO|nr:LysR family transcriptional regulator [Mycolicibacterium sp. MU0050]CAJ1587486.1 LysR family transcriptional regulator [Mycolicibacterium sp. MU0050]